MTQPSEEHVKALWQGQETEAQTMTVQAIRMLVNDHHSASRRNVIIGFAIGGLSAVLFAWCAWTAPNDTVRIGDLIMLAWTPGQVWIVWRAWPSRTPGGEASAVDLIDFYRAQVVRQAPNLRRIAAMLTPTFVAMGVILAGIFPQARQHFAQFIPVVILFVVWVVVFAVQLRRQRRRVRERLRELDALREG